MFSKIFQNKNTKFHSRKLKNMEFESINLAQYK